MFHTDLPNSLHELRKILHESLLIHSKQFKVFKNDIT